MIVIATIMTDELIPPASDNETGAEIDREEGRLMEAIQRHVSQEEPTTALPSALSAVAPDLFFLPFGTSKGSADLYRLMPANTDPATLTQQSPVWRIELRGLKGSDPLVPIPPNTPAREDKVLTGAVSLDWAATDFITLSAGVTAEERESNRVLEDYDYVLAELRIKGGF